MFCREPEEFSRRRSSVVWKLAPLRIARAFCALRSFSWCDLLAGVLGWFLPAPPPPPRASRMDRSGVAGRSACRWARRVRRRAIRGSHQRQVGGSGSAPRRTRGPAAAATHADAAAARAVRLVRVAAGASPPPPPAVLGDLGRLVGLLLRRPRRGASSIPIRRGRGGTRRRCRFCSARVASSSPVLLRSLLASIRPSRPPPRLVGSLPADGGTRRAAADAAAAAAASRWRPRILGGDRRASAVDVGGPGGGCDSRGRPNSLRKPPCFVPRPGRPLRASFPAGPCTRWSARLVHVRAKRGSSHRRVRRRRLPLAVGRLRRAVAPPPDERFRDWSGAGRVVRFLALLLRDGSLGRSPAVAHLGGSLPTRLLDALAKRYRDVRPSPAAAAAAAAGRGGG